MSEFKIQTAQNVTLEQNLAGIGHRILAFVLDTIFLLVTFWVMVWTLEKSGISDSFSSWAFMAVLLLPYFLYYPIMQYWNNGQTMGKMMLKIRVVKIDNTHPTIGDFIIRWIIRLFELNPLMPIGIIFVLINERKQRLGDMAAGTTVVAEKQKARLTHSIFEDINDEYQPVFAQVQVLNDADAQLIKTVFREAKQRQNKKVLGELSQKIVTLLEMSKPVEMSDIKFISTVLKDFNYYANL